MADVQFLGFLGPTGGHPQHITWTAEYTQNLIMRMLRPPARGNPGQWALHGTPGHRLFTSTSSPLPVDIWTKNGRLWAADAEHAYEIAENGTVTTLGAVAGDSRPARFVTNGEVGNQVGFNLGGSLWVKDLATGTFLPATGLPPNARNAQYVDGYWIVLSEGTLLFALSELLNGATYSSLDRARKTSTIDRLVGHLVVGTLLWLGGEDGFSVWSNTGAASFPYTPIDNLEIPVGLHASDSLCTVGGEVCCLGRAAGGGISVYEQQGYGLAPWSTPEVDDQISEFTRSDDAIGWEYQKGQESHYVLFFPTADVTFVGHRKTKLWHRWSYLDPASGQDAAALGRSHAYIWGKHLVGDRRGGGRILEMTGYEDDGGLIRRVRRTPHISAFQGLTIYNNLRLEIQTGDAPLTGDPEDVDPYVRLRTSENAGRTWEGPIFTALGNRGGYDHIVEFPALGSSRKGKTFEIVTSARQFIGISGAVLDVERG